MKVVKSTKTPADNFLKVSNKILRDIRVTDKARGFFLTVMSLPPDWDYSIGGLCKIFPADRNRSKTAGREQIYKRLKELMETGYVDREPLRGKLGTIEDWVYFFDPDGRAELLLTVKPEVVKPDVVKPDMAQLQQAETTQLRIQKELRIQDQSNIKGETPIAAIAADANHDPVERRIWTDGKDLLRKSGMAESSLGSFLGKMAKDYGNELLAEAIAVTQAKNPAEPKEFLIGVLRERSGKNRSTVGRNVPDPEEPPAQTPDCSMCYDLRVKYVKADTGGTERINCPQCSDGKPIDEQF